MIKIDTLLIKDKAKRIMLSLGIISIFITIYTIPIVLLAKLQMMLKIKRFWIVLQFLFALFCCWLWYKYLRTPPQELLMSYWNYIENLFLIHPFRLLFGISYGILFVLFGHLMDEGLKEWVIKEEQKTRSRLLPKGHFDYTDRSHMLLFGGTRTGKGVAINHIVNNRLVKNKNELLVMVSAKPDRGDPHGQLKHLRTVCDSLGRKLYVVSMDEQIEDRYQYNPFKHLSQDEMNNTLNSMLQFDSNYYGGHFTVWVMAIFDLIKAAGESPVSIENIIKLYNWKTYSAYAEQQYKKGHLTEDQYNNATNEMNAVHAEVAQNDSASLVNIERNCRSVFRPTPNGNQITITDAFEEKAVIYFDLNALSAAHSVKMLGGSCIMAEIQHCMNKFCDVNEKKTIIFDEASHYMNEHLVTSFFNMSASQGYQFIISTQGPSDIISASDNLIKQLNNNLGQLAFFRVSDPDDAELLNNLIGTTITAENTHRAQSIDYDLTGSIKATDQMHIPHSLIKNLAPLNMIYYQKKKAENGESRPVKITWRVDDLEVKPLQSRNKSNDNTEKMKDIKMACGDILRVPESFIELPLGRDPTDYRNAGVIEISSCDGISFPHYYFYYEPGEFYSDEFRENVNNICSKIDKRYDVLKSKENLWDCAKDKIKYSREEWDKKYEEFASSPQFAIARIPSSNAVKRTQKHTPNYKAPFHAMIIRERQS